MAAGPSTTNIDAIYAKIKARKADLIEGPKLAKLCEMRGMVNLIAELYPEGGIEDHHALERRLTDDHIESLVWILRYLGGKEHIFFDWLLRRYQIENIKVLFRAYLIGMAGPDVLPHLAEMPEAFHLPVANLLTAKNLDDFAKHIPHQTLRSATKEAVKAYNSADQHFHFEAALDRAWFERLTKFTKSLKWSDQEATAGILNFDAAVHQVMMMLRARYHYNLPFEEIEPLILFIDGGISSDSLHTGFDRSTVDESVRSLPPAISSRVPQRVKEVEEVERSLTAEIHLRSISVFYHSDVTMAVPVAWYHLKRIELTNLLRLVEGYRYSLPTTELKRRMVPPLE